MTDIPDEPITARQVEQILRAAGLSRAFARAIIAGGFKAAAGQNDNDDAEAVAALAQRIQAAAKRLKGFNLNDRHR